MSQLPDGLVVFVKKDCPTCTLVESALQEIAAAGQELSVYTQDDPSFPDLDSPVHDDTELTVSYNAEIEIVPTMLIMRDGLEQERIVGWNKDDWRRASGLADLAADLPEHRPGCGSKSVEPGVAEKLELRFKGGNLASRPIALGGLEDDIEACYDRGWSDGFPVVPPTPERVLRMLAGTKRNGAEIIGDIPPNLSPCTIEKVAINAVMAGCLPEYMPVVLAVVEAALMPEFCMHGLLCTTMFSGPVVVVNGPVTKQIGMNSGMNALGQGNRANATIGRTLQMVIRNVGGGIPGKIDRSTLGNPGKYSFCFAEDEEGSCWTPLSSDRGIAPGVSAVSLFTGNGVQGIVDQKSRDPDSLTDSIAACMLPMNHPNIAMTGDALLVISPEHERVFRLANWSKEDLRQALDDKLQVPIGDIVRVTDDVAKAQGRKTLPKLRPGGLDIVRAGGPAGMFSAVIPGWLASGETGSIPVVKAVGE
jgi:hypothetical protein